MDLKGNLIYFDTIEFHSRILRFISSGTFQARPDLVSQYYPSYFSFYKFLARGVYYIGNSNPKFSVLSDIASSLSDTLQTYGSPDILSRSMTDSNGTHWDCFLGNGDNTPHYDDRLFWYELIAN